MNVSPTVCWRPVPSAAATWVAERVEDLSDDEAASLLRDAAARGTLLCDDTPALYAWRVSRGDDAWLGVVGAVALDDVIGVAPAAPAEEIAARLRQTTATDAQTAIVGVACPDAAVVAQLVAFAALGEPTYDLVDHAGVRHTLWRIVRPMAVESLTVTLGQVERIAIVQGADVACALADLRDRRREAGEEIGAADAVLCLLVPVQEGDVLPSVPSSLLLRRV